jgi:hypothetical protein
MRTVFVGLRRRVLTVALRVLALGALASCGDDADTSPSADSSERSASYRGQVETESEGRALKVSVDLTLTTFETGADAGDGLVYGGYGARGTIDVTNESDQEIKVPREHVSVMVFDSPASWPCEDDGPTFPQLCLVSALITERPDDAPASDRLAPGESVRFQVRGRAADGGYALGLDPELAAALADSFVAGNAPAAVTLWGGPIERHWTSACGGRSGPTAVFLADGTLIGPSEVESARCTDLLRPS